jgi:hypothetical protein
MKRNNRYVSRTVKTFLNRKRGMRWISEETRLYNKYGVNGHRYINIYIGNAD